MQIAIAEYAPSSEVVADGRLYTSRYIKKSATGKDKQDWYTGYSIFMSALKSMSECNCEPSCYNCLRSYENQKIHDLLDRKLAVEFLQQFVGTVELVEEESWDSMPF